MSFLRTSIILALSVIAYAANAESEPARKTAPPPVFAQVKNTAELLDAVSKIDSQGGTISLLPGTYEIKDSIVIKSSNTYLIGSGWNTVIKKIGDGDAIVFSGSLWCCGVKNLVVEGDPNAKTGSGIVFRNGEWSGICVIDYCYLRSFPESGLKFDGNLKAPFSSNTVSNCWFQGNKGDQLSSRNNNDWYIFANQFGSGGEGARSGALLENSSAGTYTMNYHWGNKVGVRLGPGANFNRIENNRIEQSRESGLIIGDPTPGAWNSYNIITGNTIHTNSETNSGKFSAVVAYDAYETTFCTNQLMSWDTNSVRHKNGLVLERCKNWIIKDNIFRHHTEKAMVLNKKDGHIIKDNIMDKDVKPEKAKKAKKAEKAVESEE